MRPTPTRLSKDSSGVGTATGRLQLPKEVPDGPHVHSLPPGGAERCGGVSSKVSTCEAATQTVARGSHYGGRGLGPASCAS